MNIRTALTAAMIAVSTVALAGAGGGGGGGGGGGSGGGAGAGSGGATGGATGSGVGTGRSTPSGTQPPGLQRSPGVPANPSSARETAPGAVNRPESQIDRDVDGQADSMDSDTGRRR